MSYKEYKEEQGNLIVKSVNEIIETEGLLNPTRPHHIAHQRFYLMAFLRSNVSLTLQGIGDMFNKDHSTILHGIKKHTDFMDYEDPVYLSNTKIIKGYLSKEFPDSIS